MAKKAKNNDKVLPPVRPNAAVTAKLQNRLDVMIEAMNRSVQYFIEAQYSETPPEIAMDDVTPAHQLQREMRKLTKRWLKRFDEAAPKMARYFSKSAQKRSDVRFQKILKDAGFSIEFKMTPQMRDIAAATVHETTALIKSIPRKYLSDVEGAVMRSVQVGGDMGALSKHLQNTYGITKRRAAIISRDTNAKATAAMNRSRQLDLGITHAIWKHSSAGKVPRPTHVKMNEKKYEVAKGMYDSAVGRNVLPGELINCRCTAKSIIKGFI